MEVFDAIRTVLAVRQFRDQAIPEPVVKQIVEAGHLTASGGNQQPWHFIVVQNKEMLRQFGTLATTGPYIAQAPLAIVVGIEKSSQLGVSDASRAIQDMVLTAWAHGIGSNWVGYHNLEQVKPVLGIPDEIEILAIIPFGYPAKKLGKGDKKRKPLGEVAHREKWGQAFS
jgi:nitroreductase